MSLFKCFTGIKKKTSLAVTCLMSVTRTPCCERRLLTCRLSSGAFRKSALMRAMAYVWISWFDLKDSPASEQPVRSITLQRAPHTAPHTAETTQTHDVRMNGERFFKITYLHFLFLTECLPSRFLHCRIFSFFVIIYKLLFFTSNTRSCHQVSVQGCEL